VKAQRARIDAALAQAQAKLLRQERELVGPDARWHAQDEHAAGERHREGALRDAGTDGFAPDPRGDWGADARKAILSGAI
jgi:hypothetical protein